MVELVDTVVLEATASASEFESRLGHQIRKRGRVRLIATVLKTVVSKGTVSSNLTASAKFYFKESLAQLAECWSPKPEVRGSRP